MVAFADLFRAALPGTWADGAWRSVSVPIIVDGVARSNAPAPCSGYHYKVGHEVRADRNCLTYVTWTLENPLANSWQAFIDSNLRSSS